MAYAVVNFGRPDCKTTEVDVRGFRMPLDEAFAMLMSFGTSGIGSYKFDRDAKGVMQLDVDVPGPRRDLPCDYLYVIGTKNAFASELPDDEPAIAQIMLAVGEKSWDGFEIVAHDEMIPDPSFLKSQREYEMEAAAKNWSLD